MNIKNLYLILFLFVSFSGISQEMLTLGDAVKITLENDYNIRVAENSAKLAENNTSPLANGFLPTVNANGGADYKLQNSNVDYFDGTNQAVSGLSTLTYSASVSLNYVLFDGMYRTYNFEKSKELHELSKLQVRQVIEGTLVELFSAYYRVANLAEATENYRKMLEISKTRLLRANYGAEYGKNTQLDVLNAQVDVNTDSINYLNGLQSLANAKRNLNVLLGRSVSVDFNIDTSVNYYNLPQIDVVLEQAKVENVQMLTAQKNAELSNFNYKLTQTKRIPTLSFYGSYFFNAVNNNNKSLIDAQTINGPQTGLSLSWSIFDGGRTRVGLQNNKIAMETALIQQEQQQKQLERDVINSYTTYENSLFVLKAEKENVITNERNFKRTQEQFHLGQLTSVEFRQAQINLLQAKTKYNLAKYQAKIYELTVRKLTGDLLNTKF